MRSPHIDALAASGTVFTNAYCNVPVCGASRASLLTGLRPTRKRFVDYDARMSLEASDAISIAGHFKRNGYRAISLGKIAHFRDDNREHWSEQPWRPDYPLKDETQVKWRDYQSDENLKIAAGYEDGRGLPYEGPEVPDDAYYDGQVATRAAATLQELSAADEPFFLAVGLIRPHLPFNAPKKYWDLYDPATMMLPENYFRSRHAPDAAFHSFGELRSYHGVPAKGPLTDEMARKLVHGYHACVSFADAQVGRVMQALEKSGEADNTIVMLWGDHGWNLGEHTLWCKHCNFRTSLQAPLIVKAPGKNVAQKTAGLVEFVDIFPSLCDLAGLSAPEQLDGVSFVSLLDDPQAAGKPAVFCQWKMGATIKTQRHAYTEWSNDKGDVWAKMLYDHQTDPDENENVAEISGNAELVRELADMLHARPAALKTAAAE